MLIPLLLVLWGCGKPSLRPVEIESTDMCSSCRMALSEARYAAEIVDRDENVYKFDDIGCMLRFLREHKPQGAAIYVRDYDGSGWLNARDAHYVRSEAIASPMGGHTIGLKQELAAEAYAKRFHGVVLDWGRL